MAKKVRKGKARRPARRAAKRRPAARSAKVRKVQAVPKGFHAVTPNLVVSDAAAAIAWYQRALGAKELMRMKGPDGKIGHAELQIGDSIVFVNDEFAMSSAKAPGAGRPPTCSFMVYVADCDGLYARAIGAGAKSLQPVADMFWGDRMGTILDPYGVPWMIATHVKEMTQEEMMKAGQAAMEAMAAQSQAGAPASSGPPA